VRPFINAGRAPTPAMTASLMPPEVVDAITYASKHYVMLDELHGQGRRAARLPACHVRAGLVTQSGAASAPDARHPAGYSQGTDQEEDPVDLPEPLACGQKTMTSSRNRIASATTQRRPQLRRAARGGRRAREDLERGSPTARDDALLTQQQLGGAFRTQAFVQLERTSSIPTLNDRGPTCPGREPCGSTRRWGFDPRRVLRPGRALRGPQSAGLLLGRNDLIAAARLNAPPNGNTIGRGLKVTRKRCSDCWPR
jgi:L-seryl-tRNA(Ser) seleniumtransferase